ncbi:MAG: hypothetical protein PHC84_00025 [Clostridia bacterium]|nr:hypothetical protein [Clostridia bacterium]
MKNVFKKNLILSFLIMALLTFQIIIAPLFAWFVDFNTVRLTSTGSSILNYFASGKGTAASPYLIKTKAHMHNLAWLQNKGFLQDDKYYFVLDNDIDMEGLAVPPIGTSTYPFVGDFNGNKKTISNLFVSNDKNELKTQFNLSTIDLGDEIGFFGRLDSRISPYNLATAGAAYGFYLENINISNCMPNSAIGIVAGHNNGSLHEIGVSNSSFKLKNALPVKSEYTLIGETGENTEWLDSPENLGSKILIDPNDPNDLFTAISAVGSAQQYREIPNSTPEHAYMTSTLGVTYSAAGALYKITDYSSYYASGVTTWTPTAKTQIINSTVAADNGIPLEFWNRYIGNNSSTRYIVPYNNPSSAATVAVPFNGGYKQIPYNGVWFMPKSSGPCGISFSITNQSDDSAMAVYEYRRDTGGNIIDWTETRLLLEKGLYGNKGVVYFQYNVKKDYEYVVGKSTVSQNTAGFFYLVLEGVGNQGSGSQNISLSKRIDFVMRDTNDLFPDLSAESYVTTKTHLSFEGTSSSEGYIYYNKALYNSNTAVYYYSGVSSVSVEENYWDNPESAAATVNDLDNLFYDWMSAYNP